MLKFDQRPIFTSNESLVIAWGEIGTEKVKTETNLPDMSGQKYMTGFLFFWEIGGSEGD